MSKNHLRLDQRLVELGLASTRAQARGIIMSGRVMVDGRVKDKPGSSVSGSSEVSIKPGKRHVSRGGEKLEAALSEFNVDPSGKTCLDLGASTGGFTHCLLERGADKVYAVDVGKGQLDWGLRNNEQVVVMEGVNARTLKPSDLPVPVQLCVMDLSFISLTLVLPAVEPLLDACAQVIALVKPQFEAGREKVGKGGVVQDPVVIRECVDRVAACSRDLGLFEIARAPSALKGPKGNQEFFIYMSKMSC